jgi:hypothetical protein
MDGRMRTLFFVLLLANVAFFGYSWFSAALFPGESLLLQQQINPQAIRLLAPQQVAKTASAKRELQRTAACLEWGVFSGGDVGRAEIALAPLALGARLTPRRIEETAGWWVYMPPQGSRQAATNKSAELKRLGVEDFFILQEDPKFRFAISLGVFRTEEAAKNRLEQLRAQGVRTARIGARESQTVKTAFQVREASETVVTRLNEIKQTFPGSELKDCAG